MSPGPVQAGMSIDSILRRQGGVISRQQATAAGLAPGAVDDRLRRRRWRPLHPQIYLATGRPADVEVRIRAALLWAGEGSVLCGAAAAWWSGLRRLPPPTITVAVSRRPPPVRPGLTVRRRELVTEGPHRAPRAPPDGAPADRARNGGRARSGRGTVPGRCAAELATVPGPARGLSAQHVDRCPTGPGRGCSSLGRGGRPAARTAAPRFRAGQHGGGSSGGRRGGLSGGPGSSGRDVGLFVGGGGGDGLSGGPGCRSGAWVTFPGPRVVVGVTGWAWPADNRLPPVAPAGPNWTVLRFGWPDLVSRPQEVLTEIATAVTRNHVGQ